MSVTAEMLEEINLLLKFPEASHMNGLKVHHEAEESVQAAAKRLFEKGLTDQPDGGYLTDAGIELHEHLRLIHSALK